MNDREILQALQTATTAAVAASIMPALPVAYVDITFKVPIDQKYLECVFIPNNNGGDFWGEEKNYRGIYRLILHWPIDGKGPYAPMDLLASIAAYFEKGKLLQGVQIYEKPDLTGVLREGGESLFPATLRYQSFRQS